MKSKIVSSITVFLLVATFHIYNLAEYYFYSALGLWITWDCRQTVCLSLDQMDLDLMMRSAVKQYKINKGETK